MTNQPQSNDSAGPGKSRLADIVAQSLPAEAAQGLGSAAWAKLAILAALFLAINYWQLVRFEDGKIGWGLLVRSWLHDSNWSHGFIIPLFSIYLLYARRQELAACPRRTCLWGLPLMLIAICLQAVSVYPIKNDWFYQLNMLLVLLGLVLYLAGPQAVRLTWLPIAFLALAMPLPPRLYGAVAYPLQELAARSSFMILQACGVQIQNIASNLSITGQSGQVYSVTVAEACSGVRSLMAFVALGVAWAYLDYRPMWQRLVYVLAIVPIAIACNILRVIITCEMHVLDRPELGQKFMHEFTGMFMLVPAFGMLWLLGKLLQGLYVEEDELDEAGPSEEAQP